MDIEQPNGWAEIVNLLSDLSIWKFPTFDLFEFLK